MICEVCGGAWRRLGSLQVGARDGLKQHLVAHGHVDLDTIAILKCRGCGGRRHDPLLPHETYARWHARWAYTFERGGGLDQPLRVSATHANSVIETLEISPGSVLEVGPGPGTLAVLLESLGWDVTCVEISPKYASRLRAMGLRTVVEGDFLEAALTSRSFDVIVATDVLEHFPNIADECVLFFILKLKMFIQHSTAYIGDTAKLYGI